MAADPPLWQFGAVTSDDETRLIRLDRPEAAPREGRLEPPRAAVAPPSDANDPKRRTFAERLFATASWLIPFGVALSRVAPSGRWEGDVAALRDLALVSVGLGGGPSTALTQFMRLVPLGSVSFRAGLVGVVALAVAARTLFDVCLRLLRSAERDKSPWLAPTLAAVGTLTTALGPSFQREATTGGGRVVAIAALLGIVATMQRIVTGEVTRKVAALLLLGTLVGAAFAEDVAAGLLGLACLGAAFAFAGDAGPAARKLVVPRRALALTAVAVVLTTTFFALPAFIRAASPRSALDFGLPLSSRALGIASTDGVAFGSLDLILKELGWSALGLASMGFAAGLVRRSTRWQVAPLCIFVAADLSVPLGLLRRVPLASVTTCHLAAVFVLCVVAVSGVHAGVRRLLALKIPFAKPLAALSVAFHITLVALISEQAGEVADRSLQRGADEWTEGALGGLDPSAALLVRSPAKLFRLYAAQLVDGERPDVLVLPTRLFGRGSIAADLAAREREIEPLLRSVALTSASDEFSLSKLADARPLYVELDKTWDVKETSHLTVSGLWLRFAPQPLGQVDRKLATASSTSSLERMLATVAPDAWPDPQSTRVAEDIVRQQVTLLVRIGEHKNAGAILSLTRKVGAHGGVLQGSSIAVLVADMIARIHNGHDKSDEAEKAALKSLAARQALANPSPARPKRNAKPRPDASKPKAAGNEPKGPAAGVATAHP